MTVKFSNAAILHRTAAEWPEFSAAFHAAAATALTSEA